MEMAARPLSFLQEDEKSHWGARGFPECFRVSVGYEEDGSRSL